MQIDKFFNAINDNNFKLVKKMSYDLNVDILQNGAEYASILGYDNIEDYLKTVAARKNIYKKNTNNIKHLKKISNYIELFDPVYEEIIKDIYNIKLKLYPILNRWQNKTINRNLLLDPLNDEAINYKKDYNYTKVLIENLENILKHEKLLQEEKDNIQDIIHTFLNSEMQRIQRIYFRY